MSQCRFCTRFLNKITYYEQLEMEFYCVYRASIRLVYFRSSDLKSHIYKIGIMLYCCKISRKHDMILLKSKFVSKCVCGSLYVMFVC